MRHSSGLVVGLMALGACGGQPRGESVAPTVVTFTATDYAYAGPSQVPAGAVTFRLENHGTELHHAVLARLNDGKTVDDVLAFYMDRRATDPLLQEHPSFVTFLGGPGVGAPHQAVEATAVLEPGAYVLICYVETPDPAKEPHFTRGMITTFRITQNDSPAPAPAADLELKLKDYAFTLSRALTPGTHTIMVKNDGPQIHDAQFVRLQPGTTPAQFLEALAPGSTTPPPGELITGVGGLSNGESAYLTVTLERGNYVLLCFVPDRHDGAPHFAHGMMQAIVIG